MALKVLKGSDTDSIVIKDSHKRWTLNFTDIINNNNKCYNLEVITDSNGEYYIYTQYGRVGGTLAKEFRQCDSQIHAEAEAEKIVKAKTKKGYTEVKLLRADVGSDAGKAKVETNKVSIEALAKAGIKVPDAPADSSKLHPQVSSLVRTWFGITADFVELNLDTKKSPLGQLSLDQVNLGRDILEECRKLIQASKKDLAELNKLSSRYYSNIPFNFGYGKLDANALRLDDDTKIDKAFDVLDVLADAKDVQNVISKKSAVDDQYETLNAALDYVDPADPIWKWIDTLLLGTRASNHTYLGKLKTHKIFKVARKKEDKYFLETAESIAKECGKSTPSEVYAKYVKDRPDVPKELADLYKRANILPGWHGTRRANMIGITTKGLLIRPSGVIHAGSMYGDGIYWATNSTKSINYTDARGSYWAGGSASTAYLFLADCAFGNQKVVSSSHMYTKKNIIPNHSVWAKAGSAVYNDEIITYTPSGPGQQHILRYIVEFETQAR